MTGLHARSGDPVASQRPTLDPEPWGELRELAHRMLDDMLDYTAEIRSRPVWQAMPEAVRQRFRAPLPVAPGALADAYREFQENVLPYAGGNVHPGFMGWVQGGGTAVGMLAEMLAAGLNANLGGRDHAPIEIERQVSEWMRQVFGFPGGASGLFVTGSSQANFIAVLMARDAALRATGGSGNGGGKLTAYTSCAAHACIARAMRMAGLGEGALRRIPVDERHRVRPEALRAAVAADVAAGLTPFLLVGTAGTVDIGATDPLLELSEIATRTGMWFHVDGAFGAWAKLAPALAPRLDGIERADSIACDFHKWAQTPYDAGFILVRDGNRALATFAVDPPYLRHAACGAAAGSFWPCDYGPDLSRGFRALKAWFTLKVYGTERLGEVVAGCCRLAQYLETRIAATATLELAAPVQLNIVCFRFGGGDGNAVNTEIAAAIQQSGIAVPSTTVLDGRVAIRAAIVNHRTQPRDLDALVEAAVRFGREITTARGRARPPRRMRHRQEPESDGPARGHFPGGVPEPVNCSASKRGNLDAL
ncbi:MAG: pyridoxal phosphate-dependent decarboxylase family protein [Terriglobales bacterium]